ncbi:MAG TPA: hypothetical protein VNC41_16995, partial [Acidimicrobiia bacterium]|nr:hypothetical protein [Acidimicrobiia bacterium]
MDDTPHPVDLRHHLGGPRHRRDRCRRDERSRLDVAQPRAGQRVDVREVGPRDGLQNEAPVPVDARVRLIDALARTGLRHIEAAAFVSSAAIPPMAGAAEVMAQ